MQRCRLALMLGLTLLQRNQQLKLATQGLQEAGREDGIGLVRVAEQQHADRCARLLERDLDRVIERAVAVARQQLLELLVVEPPALAHRTFYGGM